MTHKWVKFVWNEDCEVSFQRFKECLTFASVLALSSKIEGYAVYCVASKDGLGCVLM